MLALAVVLAVAATEVTASKGVEAVTDVQLLYDANGNGKANPGDVVQFSTLVTVSDTGAPLEYDMAVPPELRVKEGGVEADGATSWELDHGSLLVRWAEPQAENVVTFSGVVKAPVAAAAREVCAQAVVNGVVRSSTWSVSAPTPACVALDAHANIVATKHLVGSVQEVSTGDVVAYSVVVENTGDRDAENATYRVGFEHMHYLDGSFRMVEGPKPRGLSFSRSELRVDLGELRGNHRVSFEYSTVVGRVGAGVSALSAQGEVQYDARSFREDAHPDRVGNGRAVARTDNPRTHAPRDATSVSVYGAEPCADDVVLSLTVRHPEEVDDDASAIVASCEEYYSSGGSDPCVNTGGYGRIFRGSQKRATARAVADSQKRDDDVVYVPEGYGGYGYYMENRTLSPGDVIFFYVYADLNGNSVTNALYENTLPEGLELIPGTVETWEDGDYDFRLAYEFGRQKNLREGLGDPRPYSTGRNYNQRAVDELETECEVRRGNRVGDTDVSVKINGEELRVRYQVRVTDPFTGEGTLVENQGVVYVDGEAILSDDPETAALGDPTNLWVEYGDLALCDVTAIKTAVVECDEDGDGRADPEDVIRYTVEVSNAGWLGATGVVFTDVVDRYTTLVVGTVTTTCGEVIVGNSYSKCDADPECRKRAPYGVTEDVRVNLGGIKGDSCETCVITFDVLVNSVLPAGVSSVSNQGVVTGNNFGAVVTTDGQGAVDAPTVTAVDGRVDVDFTTSASLALDYDWDGRADPGESLRYTVSLANKGTHDIEDAYVSVLPDPNTDLNIGSVQASGDATVALGNRLGDDAVVVKLGTLAGRGGAAAFSFTVTVHNPLASNAESVYLQAKLRGVTFHADHPEGSSFELLSSDASTTVVEDPSITPVEAHADVVVTTAAEHDDANGDGAVNPHESFHYEIVLSNIGDQDGADAVLVVTVDPRLTLEPAGISTSQGRVLSGNSKTGNDNSLTVFIGELAGQSGTAVVSFSASANEDFTGGVQLVTTAVVSGANFEDVSVTADEYDAPVVPVHLDAAQTYTLAVDNDNSGDISPGDVLAWTVVVTNHEDSYAAAVYVTPDMDASTSLVQGSVTASQGSVLEGNYENDVLPRFAVGDLSAGQAATLTWEVTIANPVAAWVTEVSGQSTVTGTNLDTVRTTDPRQKVIEKATIVPLAAAPSVGVAKTWALYDDTNANGLVDPGEFIEYTLRVTNAGNMDAAALTLTDVPDVAVDFEAGSVTTTAGEVLYGNGADLPGAEVLHNKAVVAMEGLAGQGGSATVTFRVAVPEPFLGQSAVVSNQASIAGENVALTVSDDPTTNLILDPTLTAVNAAPAWEVSSEFSSLDSLRTRVQYDTTVTNTGTQQAYSVTTDLTFGGEWGLDQSVAVTTSPEGCCEVTFVESESFEGPGLSRVAVSVDTSTVAAGDSFSLSVVLVQNQYQPCLTTDADVLVQCLSLTTTISGDQFDTFTQSVVQLPAAEASAASARSLTLDAVDARAMPAGDLKRQTMGVEGVVDVENLSREGDVAAEYGDVLRYIIKATVLARPGDAVRVWDNLDPAVMLVPGSISAVAGEITAGTEEDAKRVEVTYDIREGGILEVYVVFDVVALPNFNGALPQNHANVAVNQRSVSLDQTRPVLFSAPDKLSAADVDHVRSLVANGASVTASRSSSSSSSSTSLFVGITVPFLTVLAVAGAIMIRRAKKQA
eukprot:CAMPEP_0119130698 /NCGR_PEP_ID=MMETSP1310-20130426/8467_1 /TAXON_ID=464262 /ORGANISM="Genus nov. species nov., Strain RCC2339" /LENGTH=1697 /DNA_ID=CAMNT_0007121225 /DNA_START=107 /DNA_END=5200 /DNA_ORIENTATION=+